jgi:biopolymer transport protein ExbB
MDAFFQRLSELFTAGGPVMWPLVVLSVLSVAMSFERSVYWFRTHGPGRRAWLRKLGERLRTGDISGVQATIAKDGSVYARTVEVLLGTPPGQAPIVADVVEQARHECERFGASQSTIITAAPLLGILGTVLGIIESFDLLGSGQAVTDISAVAAGIAEALITTAMGLIVALITIFPYMAFRAHASRCVSTLEALAATAAISR